MAIAFRSAATANTGNSTASSITINKPSGVVEGDFLLAAVTAFGGTGTTITPPSGWTLVRRADEGTNTATATYYKFAGASEPTGYTFGLSNPNVSTIGAAGGISAYTGVDKTAPVNASAGAAGSTASTSVVTPAVTTTVADALVIRAHGTRILSDTAATITPPPGTAERWEVANSPAGGNTRTAEAADAPQAAVGASGTATATASSSVTHASQTVALAPAVELVGMVRI